MSELNEIILGQVLETTALYLSYAYPVSSRASQENKYLVENLLEDYLRF